MKKRVDAAHRAILQLISAPNGAIDNPFRSVAIQVDEYLNVEQTLIRQVADVIYDEIIKAPTGAFASPEYREAMNDLMTLCSGWWGRVTARHVVRAAVRDCFVTNQIYYCSLENVGDRCIYDLIVAKSQ